MTDVTFNEIQKMLAVNLVSQRNTLKRQLVSAKAQYRFSCENYGNCSEQAGRYDKIICAMQTAIMALEEVQIIHRARAMNTNKGSGITMTTKQKHMYTKAAQELGRLRGYRFIQKNMIILEGSTMHDELLGRMVDYVMFKDSKTGKQYQCWYDRNSGVSVAEFVPHAMSA